MRETTHDVFSVIGKLLTLLVDTMPTAEKIVTGLLRQDEEEK